MGEMMVPDDIVRRVDRLARTLGCTRAEALRYLVGAAELRVVDELARLRAETEAAVAQLRAEARDALQAVRGAR